MSEKPAKFGKKVAIIGGGVIGLAIGWRLCAAGCRVELFEKDVVGRGASWAAGGMLAAAAEYEPGFEPGLAFGRWSQQLWPGFLDDLYGVTRLPTGYRTEGTLVLAQNEQERDDLAATFERQLVLGASVRWVSPAEAFDLEPALNRSLLGGYFCAEDFQLDARLLLASLAAAFTASGGVLHERCAIEAVQAVNGRAVSVTTALGDTISADVIVMAGGWESNQITVEGLGDLPTIPVKGEMVALRLEQGSSLQGHVVRLSDVYLVPKEGRRLVLGATSHIGHSDREVTIEDGGALVEAAVSAVPQLRGMEIEERWAGVRPGTPDGLPILGTCPVENLVLATGHYRNGILWTPATAELISNLITNQQLYDFADKFSFERFLGQGQNKGLVEAG